MTNREAELEAQIDAFWSNVQHGWDIEPREYFEREAPLMGYGSPMAMAAHYMWKREVNRDADLAPANPLCYSQCNPHEAVCGAKFCTAKEKRSHERLHHSSK